MQIQSRHGHLELDGFYGDVIFNLKTITSALLVLDSACYFAGVLQVFASALLVLANAFLALANVLLVFAKV
jgi:hypothetical protein